LKWNHAVVRAAVARHAHCSPSDIRPWHHLQEDLGLAPLDIALAAAELEELAGIDLSAEALGSVATVGDLSWVFLSTLQGLQPEAVDPSHRARRA
jgi:hypothetical protein